MSSNCLPMCSHTEILPVWSLISLMCVCVGKLWGKTTIQATLKTLYQARTLARSLCSLGRFEEALQCKVRSRSQWQQCRMFGWPFTNVTHV